MPQNVQPDQINSAESRRLGPADRLSSERVHIFNAEIQFLHQSHDVQYGKRTDAISDEVRCVLGEDNAFAQLHIGEVHNRVQRSTVSFRRRDNFQQPHIARRIEKMRAKPRPPEIVREPFGNLPHRQPASVGGDDRARPSHGFHLLEQPALDLEILNYGFDDPVHFRQPFQIIFKVADRNQSRQRRLKKSPRLGFFCRFQPPSGDFIARRPLRIGRNDVQQIARNACIGEMCGDARAHSPGAQNRNFMNALHERKARLRFSTLL